MPTVETGPGPIYYDLVDLTPPWLEAPPTILFNHGVGIDRRIWTAWLPALARTHRLVCLDMRGYGKSHIPEADFDWTIDGLAQDLLAVADDVGAERFHYVGEAMGGVLGFYLAIHHRQRLLSLGACTSACRGGAIGWLSEWRAFIEANGMAACSARMMEGRFPPDMATEAGGRWFDSVQAACAPETIVGNGNLLMSVDLTDDLNKIETPTILISPDSSPLLDLSVTLEIRDKIGHAALSVIAGGRHGVVFTHPRACVNAYKGFLDRLGAH